MENDSKLRELIRTTSSIYLSNEDQKSRLQNARNHIRRTGLERVDQFAVQSRLQGLEERWRVSFDNDLADELEGRVRALSLLESEFGYRFLPECLQFLLCLSNGAPNFAFHEHIDRAHEQAQEGRPLSPERFTSADAASDIGLWQDIDYGAPASDSDGYDDDDAPTQVQPGLSDRILPGRLISDYAVDEVLSPLDNVYAHSNLNLAQAVEIQDAIEQIAERKIPESVALNEVIASLCGLPSSLFISSATGQIAAAPGFLIHGTTEQVFRELLTAFATLGSKVVHAQGVARRRGSSPVINMYQHCIRDCLCEFYKKLASYEYRALEPRVRQHSLLSLYREANTSFTDIDALVSIFPFLQHKRQEAQLLDQLIEMISEQEYIHGAHKDGLSAVLIRCFTRCFEIYWRPFDSWLSGNNLGCLGLPLIQATQLPHLSLACWWETAYKLDKSASPLFLQKHLPRILSIGKTSLFLGKIARAEREQLWRKPKQPGLDESIDLFASEGLLFEPFEARIDRLVQSGYLDGFESTRSQLLKTLRETYRLVDVVRSLQMIYFSEIGSANEQAFAGVFNLIDTQSQWHDRLLLTDIFQRAFEHVLPTSAERLTVFVSFDERVRQARRQSLIKLEAVKLLYRLPEPLANIIDHTCLSAYQRIATLLLQIARAKSCLNRFFGIRDGSISRASAESALSVKLRCNLRWFISTLHKHVSFSILPFATDALLQQISSATDMDGLIQDFTDILTLTERRCLVSDALQSTNQAIVSMLDLAVVLTDVTNFAQTNTRFPPNVSDDEEDVQNSAAQSINISVACQIEYPQLQELCHTYKQLMLFIHARTKEVARSTSDTMLELLASDFAFIIDSPSFCM